MPLFDTFCEMEVRIEILDSKENILAKYSTKSYDKAKIGLYTGYSIHTAKDKVLLEAIEKCFTDILNQISIDQQHLIKSLNTSGKIE